MEYALCWVKKYVGSVQVIKTVQNMSSDHKNVNLAFSNNNNNPRQFPNTGN